MPAGSHQPMNPRDFLSLAKKLFQEEKNSAGLRSSLSRAYYAAFNVAAEFLHGIGCDVPEDANGHKKAYYYLNNCGDEALVNAAGDLDDLRGQRNIADYKLSKPHVEKDSNVQNWLDVASRIIAALDECQGSKERKQGVKTAVVAYKSQNVI